MSKRKRDVTGGAVSAGTGEGNAKRKKTLNGHSEHSEINIQIVVGTYEKVLHGIQASVRHQAKDTAKQGPSTTFSDTFLLSPHGSAIRCLAISPPSTSDATDSQKTILASGSSDQTINLYHISREALPSRNEEDPQLPTISGRTAVENPRNRELGSLQHHGGSINALYFPTRSKLLSAAEDSTITVARTRDWTVLSTIKAPIPKAHGRPSGDTAPLGGTPAGINDLAIHPSNKLMITVGKGEKCMRLWNLITGKKGGVLSFERDLLKAVGEGRYSNGEGRRVRWNNLGEEFVVAFERGCVIFGMDCKPKGLILPSPSTKIHQLHYMPVSTGAEKTTELLTISTEDGRLIFYSPGSPIQHEAILTDLKIDIPVCEPIGHLGGKTEGLYSRIKDFELLKPPNSQEWIIVTGNSDGAIRLWKVKETELQQRLVADEKSLPTTKDQLVNGRSTTSSGDHVEMTAGAKIGQLIGTYEAGNRITCLRAFTMVQPRQVKVNGSATAADVELAKQNNTKGVEDESSSGD